MVAADIDDAGTLRRAFEGAYGAFCVTFFWDHFSRREGVRRGGGHGGEPRSRRGSSTSSGLLSTIPASWIPLSDNRMPTLGGKYKVPHFDAKGEADALFTELGVPTTFLQTVVLLGEFHLLRRRPEARTGR